MIQLPFQTVNYLTNKAQILLCSPSFDFELNQLVIRSIFHCIVCYGCLIQVISFAMILIDKT